MRILDYSTDKAIDDICLYLTVTEASELIGWLSELIRDPGKQHAHLSDNAGQRELSVAVYTEENLQSFDERSVRLIKEGK